MAGFDEVWQQDSGAYAARLSVRRGEGPSPTSSQGTASRPSTTNRQAATLTLRPGLCSGRRLDGPGQLQDLQGASYLFAILTDPRRQL